MRYYITILLLLSTFVFSDNYCGGSCDRVINKEDLTFKNSLTCRLPAMPTFEISAPNVLESDGRLKYYWSGNTVCDVLGWLNEGASHFKDVKGMDISIDSDNKVDFTLNISPMAIHRAGTNNDDGLQLDSTPFSKNRFARNMHATTVHKFFHYAVAYIQGIKEIEYGLTAWSTEG
jgi:hypothetical protein